jgi:hypothetical protein
MREGGKGRAKILAFQYYISSPNCGVGRWWEGEGGGGGGRGEGKEGGAVSKVNALSRVPYRTAPPQQQKFVYTGSVANSSQPIAGQSGGKFNFLGNNNKFRP